MSAVDWAMLLLRVVVGAVMVAHGVRHARGRERTTAWFDKIGFRMPAVQWLASTATELAVGALLIAGALTSLAAAGVIGITVVAFWSVHRYAGFWVTARPDEGWEYVMTLAAVAAAIAIIGPGEVSVDRLLGIDDVLDGWVGAALAGGGVVLAAVQAAAFYRPGEASR